MSRNLSIDILKLLMAFFVVALHFSFFKEINKDISFILNQGIFRSAVPIFLIINGYFFFKIQNKVSYLKWLRKIIFIYIFWTAVYAHYWLQLDFKHIVQSVFYGYFHLWYISGLIAASFFVYFLRNARIQVHLGIAAILYFVGCTLQYLSSYGYVTLFQEFKNSNSTGIPTFVFRNFLFVCIPFMLVGFTIKKMENLNFDFTKLNKFLVFSFVLLMIEIIFNLFYSVRQNFDILFALILFCPLLFLKVKELKVSANLKTVGLISSAIYFVHPLVHFIFFSDNIYTPTSIVLMTFFTSLIVAIPIIIINKKIPIL